MWNGSRLQADVVQPHRMPLPCNPAALQPDTSTMRRRRQPSPTFLTHQHPPGSGCPTWWRPFRAPLAPGHTASCRGHSLHVSE
jgi:hypothetical protein